MSAERTDRTTHPSANLGAPRVHLRRVDSTNERARQLAGAGAPHGTLVTASAQTAGRGRQGRRWSAPPDSSILMSLLLRSPPPLLPLAAAVAVCDFVGASSPEGEVALIKWPNDVVVASSRHRPRRGEGGPDDDSDAPGHGARLAKLAGILIEARPQEHWAVLGIGVNVALELADLPPELRGTGGEGLPAATLGLTAADVEPALARLLDALARRLEETAQETLSAWRARDALLDREVAWAGGSGRARGIDGEGRLLVALADGGQLALGAGEVHLHKEV